MPKFIGVNISGTVVGHYLPYGGTVLPANFLWCDGASYLRTAFPVLFAAIGTVFGAADGTHFNVPDWRSRFLRGCDNMGVGAAGRDPGGRVVMAAGGNAAGLGSAQADAFQGFIMSTIEFGGIAASSTTPNQDDGSSGSGYSNKRGLVVSVGNNPAWGTDAYIRPITNDGTNGVPRVSSESRPLNGNSNFIIAYI
jgi:hypothetical protein